MTALFSFFSFNDANNNKVFCGIYHVGQAFQVTTGQQTQVTAVQQLIQQGSFQGSTDPQTWIEDIKAYHRSGDNLAIVYDDALSVPYTTLTNQTFTLQFLHSLAG
jgi:hypothetical protein